VLWCCWLGGRKGNRPVKTEWWDAGLVMCLGQGADLRMAQLMPLPLTISCSSKSRLVLPFWCWLTCVVRDKTEEGRKMVVCDCVCVVCVIASYLLKVSNFNLPHLHLLSPLGLKTFEFHQDCWLRKTRVPGLSYDIVCLIVHLAVLTQYRLVTDRQTHDDSIYCASIASHDKIWYLLRCGAVFCWQGYSVNDQVDRDSFVVVWNSLLRLLTVSGMTL